MQSKSIGMNEKFYTYLWLREDGTPYYVGKGFGGRASRTGSPPRERIIVQYFESEKDALDAERFLISFYGRADNKTGILHNITDGGDGPSGAIISAARRLQIGVLARGNKSKTGIKASIETREKMRLSHIGKKYGPPSEETRRKIGFALTGRKYIPSAEHKMSISIALKKRAARLKLGSL